MTSPGLSSVPANNPPIMTQSAPAAMAFVMSPEYLTPPSAMSGTPAPRVAREHSEMAVICGTPAPVTTRVVQIDPGPIPTLIPSTRSEEHTSELQSHHDLVCRLLLEKKK